MKIRKYRPSDAEKVDEIYERCHGHFNLPEIDKCLLMAVVENDNGEVIALGAFQVIPELILVLDNHRPKREQVAALKELLIAGDFTAALHGFNKVYAFPDSNKYADVLKKHFGFKDDKPILKKEVNGGEQ